MTTQLTAARQGILTPEMESVSKTERLDPEQLRQLIAQGQIVIPANKNHLQMKFRPVGIGKNLSTKINANIGSSDQTNDLDLELKKVRNCRDYGADTLMDLSIAGDLDTYRTTIIQNAGMPVGTVPLYQIVAEYGALDFTPKDCLKVIEKQAHQGVDYMTLHAGFKSDFLPLVEKRTMGTVSRGGGIIKQWMEHHGQENPLLQVYDEISDILTEYDVTYSLGDGLRPGALCDAGDEAQMAELKFMGDLTLRAWEKGVQVMIEGPGHVPLHQIQAQMEAEKKYCHQAPFYVLGPLTIDSGAGYDHITGAIGGAVAGMYGADMLCYVTPAEHLRLPDDEDVREGIMAFKIAARSADIAKGIPGVMERETEMSVARKNFDWKTQMQMSLDPKKFKAYRCDLEPGTACGMCGEKFCPMKK